MPRDALKVEVPAEAEAVFALVHDYGRRLEWDTLLREAVLLDGAVAAGKGVRSRCTGRGVLGGIAMETEYVSYEPGRVAAVRLTNHPPFFARFAATIRHRPLEGGRSEVEYLFSFRARPRWLAWLLEPVMRGWLRRETRRRLRGLAAHFARAA